MTHKTVNQVFKESIEFLKSENGISFKVIGDAVGINENKMKAIRRGKSSATQQELEKLFEVYPILNENTDKSELEKQVAKHEERINQLEQLIIKALNRIENLEEEAGEHGLDNSDLKQLAAEKKRRNEELKKEKGIE